MKEQTSFRFARTVEERIEILHARRAHMYSCGDYEIAPLAVINRRLREFDFALVMLGEISVEVYAESWREFDAGTWKPHRCEGSVCKWCGYGESCCCECSPDVEQMIEMEIA